MAATQIPGRQIADLAITNAKIAAGAGIVTSKLADGADFLKRTGTIAMTGTLDMGNQLISNLQTPSGANDAVNKAYVDGLIAGLNSIFDGKGSVRAASTANVLVSNPGTAVFDGVTLLANERVLLKNQTSTQENGIYIFNSSSTALTRATDFDAWNEIPGAIVPVEEGTAHGDTLWLSTANKGGTLGTTPITWFALPMTAGTTGYLESNFVTREVPSGAINGSNVTYTLANTPVAGSEEVFVNGILQEVGAGNDYTISGGTITILSALATGEKIRVNYRK